MDRAGLLASRVRMFRSGFVRGLPGNFPVAEGNVLAYSCAAARELHPLPCLRRAAKTRFPRMTKSGAMESRLMGGRSEVKWGAFCQLAVATPPEPAMAPRQLLDTARV
jgi:hypothetical protein